jgi:SAM-dependent methyltransferase
MMGVFVSQPLESGPSIVAAARQYWGEQASLRGSAAATIALLGAFWEFLRDSTPSRQRQRFGDSDFDWDYRVNTTSGAVGWRDRLLGSLYSAYQPTEPASFHEMIEALRRQSNVDLREFTFIDLGSGKGRTLLMASDYPFVRIVGVELLPSLNEIARENIQKYKSDSQKCLDLESICGDAAHFPIPGGPLLIYLFNPFPEGPLRQVLQNLENAIRTGWRPVYVLYHNPQLESVLAASSFLRNLYRSEQYSIFAALQ